MLRSSAFTPDFDPNPHPFTSSYTTTPCLTSALSNQSPFLTPHDLSAIISTHLFFSNGTRAIGLVV
ncbi:hypothetical protein CCHR01_01797 [Colletotrichum chrysophilum]|uniref:Uncharacterized protein n=1 Tax=Colletotrichum chrysophilum TaxID=1836956 RepID=A0AAD9AY22_9PEZI|nr:hypothetical protein CCHR01_01797 [Colletotrichum chrysophilum]